MEYHVYTTDAIIIGAYARGEADKQLVLLTRDMGVIYADVKNIRGHVSKLRFALQYLSLAQVSFVRGRRGWRIINAIPRVSFALRIYHTDAHMHLSARIIAIVRRLVAGEEKHEELFFIVYHALCRLSSTHMSVYEVRTIELLVLLKIVSILGYVDVDDRLEKCIQDTSSSSALCREVNTHRSQVIHVINASLEVSQLVY